MDGEKDMANPLILANKKGTKGNARGGTNREKEKARTT